MKKWPDGVPLLWENQRKISTLFSKSSALSRLGKKEITLHQAKGLLAGKEIPLKWLKKKSREKFEARGKLVKNDSFGWQVELAHS